MHKDFLVDETTQKLTALQEDHDGADGRQGLGRTGSSGSSFLGYSLFVFFSSVIMAMHF